MTTKINPTYLLKGVDPQKLIEKYHSGFFRRAPIAKTKIKVIQSAPILAETYGTTNRDSMFSVKDRNNCSIVIATSNHADFELFTKTGGSLSKGGRCEFCHEDYQTESIGYPVAYKEQQVLVNTEGAPRYRLVYSFWVEGKFCSFECALGFVRNILGRPGDYRDTLLKDSERLLKLLYRLTYPNNGPLRVAQDPRLLLAGSGGALTREKWQDSRHVYQRTDRVVTIPLKVEYIQQMFQQPVLSLGITQEIVNNNSTSVAVVPVQ